jgi:tetratricopeptide (TPR) repeat protein
MKTALLVPVIWLAGLVQAFGQSDPQECISKSQALQTEGKFAEAVDLMRDAVKTFPDNARVHFELGNAIGQSAQHTQDMMASLAWINEAFVEWEKAVTMEPENVEYHITPGIAGIMVPTFIGKLDSGVGHLEKAISIFNSKIIENAASTLPVVYRFIGHGYRLQGKNDQARQAWEKVLAMTTEGDQYNAAKTGLAELAQAESQAKAVKLTPQAEKLLALQKKAEASPKDIGVWIDWGKACLEVDDYPQARKAFKGAEAQDSTRLDVQWLILDAISRDASKGYDERVNQDQSTRTGLAFDYVNQMAKILRMDPKNPRARFQTAVSYIQMPFFVNKMDQGISILESLSKDEAAPDSTRGNALFWLGVAYRKKGHAMWMKTIKDYPKNENVTLIYNEYGLRENSGPMAKAAQSFVSVTFHMGFQDELAPQTGVWVEDASGKFVKTLYVSGFAGYAKEKQIDLPEWGRKTAFETDGTTGASIDWGKHTFFWDLTDHNGKRVADGTYKVQVEVSWWPTMQYGRADADIVIGKTSTHTVVEKAPLIPRMEVRFENITPAMRRVKK